MANTIKIGLIGGDRRMLAAARMLSGAGECAVWGFGGIRGSAEEARLAGCVRCADWKSAVRRARAVILPLPAADREGRLRTPLAGEGESRGPELGEICREMSPGSLLFGGKLPALIRTMAIERGLIPTDYYEDEAFQIGNAPPTAEGAIAAAITELPGTVLGMRAVVLGYGRVGRALAPRLRSLGAEVTVAARSGRDLAWARADGCAPVPLDEYRERPILADAIFNTVPVRLLDEETLARLGQGTVIFELASENAGVDCEAAGRLGVRVVSLPSLPGRFAPDAAGESIGKAVLAVLRERGIVGEGGEADG